MDNAKNAWLFFVDTKESKLCGLSIRFNTKHAINADSYVEMPL